MKICFFGSYDKYYSRNQIILKGLELNRVPFVEVHLDLPKSDISEKEHLTAFVMFKRLLRKIKLIPVVFRNLGNIRQSDLIFAAFPAQLDLPLAYIVSRLFRKPLVFDPSYALSSVFIGEFGLLSDSGLRAKLIKWIDKISFYLPDLILFDTELSRDYYQKLFNIPLEKTRILNLAADDSIYKFSGINLDKKILSIIYYGLYNPMHGVEHIIDCANLCRKEKDIEFVLIGKGQTYAENKKRSDDLKLGNVKFMPEVTEKDAGELLAGGDIFLGFLNKSFSSECSVPNKVFQGLAMGKAVITAETAITKAVFTHKENIYLCKAADANALRDAIMELKNDVNLRKKIAANGYKLFKEKFTPKTIGNDLKLICEELINKSK